jgi:hypothetical protein
MAGGRADKQPPDALAVGRVRYQVGTAPVVGSAQNDSIAAGEHAYWGASGFVKIGMPTPLLIKELGASRPPENPAEPRGGETPLTRAPSSSTTPLGGRPSTTQTMKKVDNSNVTASPRGGVGSNVMRIQSTATQVNTIRRSRLTSLRVKGEVEPGTDISGATRRSRHGGLGVTVGVVGGSRLERGCACEDGRTLRIGHPPGCRGEVRAPIVAEKRGNARGAKGGRKANGRTT